MAVKMKREYVTELNALYTTMRFNKKLGYHKKYACQLDMFCSKFQLEPLDGMWQSTNLIVIFAP